MAPHRVGRRVRVARRDGPQHLLVLARHGTLVFGHHGIGSSLLLASTGLVTAVPLIAFGAAATRLNLTTIGLLQYIARDARSSG